MKRIKLYNWLDILPYVAIEPCDIRLRLGEPELIEECFNDSHDVEATAFDETYSPIDRSNLFTVQLTPHGLLRAV